MSRSLTWSAGGGERAWAATRRVHEVIARAAMSCGRSARRSYWSALKISKLCGQRQQQGEHARDGAGVAHAEDGVEDGLLIEKAGGLVRVDAAGATAR